ncbi:MAG: hypothetical protein U0271_17595 [Polyangiaceae bacterium]
MRGRHAWIGVPWLLFGCGPREPAESGHHESSARVTTEESSSRVPAGKLPPLPPNTHLAARGASLEIFQLDADEVLVVERAQADSPPRFARVGGGKATRLRALDGLEAVLPKGVHAIAAAAAGGDELAIVAADEGKHECVVALHRAKWELLGAAPQSESQGCALPIAAPGDGTVTLVTAGNAGEMPIVTSLGADRSKASKPIAYAQYNGKSPNHCGFYTTSVHALARSTSGAATSVGTPCGPPMAVLEHWEAGSAQSSVAVFEEFMIDMPTVVEVVSTEEVWLRSSPHEGELWDVRFKYEKGAFRVVEKIQINRPPTPYAPDWQSADYQIGTSLPLAGGDRMTVLIPNQQPATPTAIVVSEKSVDAPVEF